MNHIQQAAAKSWLIGAVGALIIVAGLSFLHNAAQSYLMKAKYGVSMNTAQLQAETEEVDKSLYALHLTTVGQETCGCPYCCAV